jgi:carboxyvinyl-carboxyphosphonate phosphorylmutase
MAFRKRREVLRTILNGQSCIRPGSVYDAISIRIAEDLGFEVGMFGGSVASLAVLGDPDIALITLTELAEQMRRMSRAAALPVLVDADHGYGNALNVRCRSWRRRVLPVSPSRTRCCRRRSASRRPS